MYIKQHLLQKLLTILRTQRKKRVVTRNIINGKKATNPITIVSKH